MGRSLKDSQKQRIKELKRALADALLKVKFYEQLTRLTEQEEKITILKKWHLLVQAMHQQGEGSIERLCGCFGYTKQAYYQRLQEQTRHRNQREEILLAVRQWRH